MLASDLIERLNFILSMFNDCYSLTLLLFFLIVFVVFYSYSIDLQDIFIFVLILAGWQAGCVWLAYCFPSRFTPSLMPGCGWPRMNE